MYFSQLIFGVVGKNGKAKIVTQATVCGIFDPASENPLSELLRFWSHRQSPESRCSCTLC